MPIPSDYASPTRMSAKERAYTQIHRWIIDGTLQPKEQLIDAELAEALGVSRTPIREALLLLEVQGLVEVHPGKATIVKDINKDDILKLYPVFATLHALATELATSVIGPDQMEQLKMLNAKFAEAIENKQPYQAMEMDEQFHNLIVEISDNLYVSTFSSTIQTHIRRFKYVFLKQHETNTDTSVEEHEAIIEAMEQRDAVKASAIMKQNLLRPMNELYTLI
ncbi:GntR family transcriptional regulator [Paenibacillus sp. CMAA1364]